MRAFSLISYSILFSLVSFTAFAETLRGTVTGVADGDTVYVRAGNGQTYKIRLLGIDAPESQQAFGEASKGSLKRMTYSKSVVIDWQQRDQYGRLVGKLLLASGLDASLAQLEAGMAWWNSRYAHEQTDDDAIRYREAAFVARKKRVGLWSQENPTPPWRWRFANPRQHGTASP